jgi:hypothetical protein
MLHAIIRNMDFKLDVIGRLWSNPRFAGEEGGRTYIFAHCCHDAITAADAVRLKGEPREQLRRELFKRLEQFKHYVNEVEILNAIEQMERGAGLDKIVWDSPHEK